MPTVCPTGTSSRPLSAALTGTPPHSSSASSTAAPHRSRPFALCASPYNQITPFLIFRRRSRQYHFFEFVTVFPEPPARLSFALSRDSPQAKTARFPMDAPSFSRLPGAKKEPAGNCPQVPPFFSVFLSFLRPQNPPPPSRLLNSFISVSNSLSRSLLELISSSTTFLASGCSGAGAGADSA